jgi:hypothetical protein
MHEIPKKKDGLGMADKHHLYMHEGYRGYHTIATTLDLDIQAVE